MINYEVAMRMVTLILWALGAVWSLFMVMVLSIIRVVKVIH